MAIGNPSQREIEANFFAKISACATPLNIISSTCYIAKSSKIKKNSGVIALPRAIIGSHAHIGKFALIGSGAIIEHDCNIEEFCTIGPGAVICGSVNVGNSSFVGANATVIQSLSIGGNSIIGAGAVVIRDVGSKLLAIGNPSKTKKREKSDCNPL
ncbi:acetyltransferase [Cyanobium sp. HWJ4-Hawea]|nr:acetyltransferase [Cyanobium sp. HWJ4-Hawea]